MDRPRALTECGQNEVLVSILHTDQRGLKSINIIFKEFVATFGYFEEAVYSVFLLNADGIISKNYFVSLSNDEILPEGKC